MKSSYETVDGDEGVGAVKPVRLGCLIARRPALLLCGHLLIASVVGH